MSGRWRTSWVAWLACVAVGCGGSNGSGADRDGGRDEGTADATVGGGDEIDLADVVGGGDGTGNGGDQGIDMLTGMAATVHAAALDCPANTLVAVAHPLVDGVFCPDGGEGEDVPINVAFADYALTGVPDWNPSTFTQSTWDHLWNGANTDVDTGFSGPQIGAHANKGITFDLGAIEAMHGGQAVRFRAEAGIGTRSPLPENVVSFLVFADTELLFSQRSAAAAGSRFPIDVPLQSNAAYLTLITSATGDIQGDWSFWGRPTLVLDDR